MAAKSKASASASGVRPFTVEVPEQDLQDMRARVAASRLPERETVRDQSQGVQLDTMEELIRYWANDYDWRPMEARLNSVPQFITEIDGLDIHFIHVRSPHEDALPLIITHGWPGSVIEQMKVIDLLTDPTAHGASATDAFDLVIPSLPGYGFSAKPTTTGWDPVHIARAWVELMRRLGYPRFVAQGGDWGAIITDVMAGGRDAPAPAEHSPPELLGIHTNMPGAVPPEIDKAIQAGEPAPSSLSDDEKRAWDELAFVYAHVGYAGIMGSRPQTLYGLTDSPAGLAGFMLDHDARSYNLIARAFGGEKEGLSRDDILDNISLFWLTNTGVSAARLYWENKFSYFAAKNVTVPAAVSVFPDELYQAPRSWAEQAYPNLMYFNELDRGGHFAAWEQPELFASEVRAGFRPLRA